jgi:hypothetical protein
LRFLKKSFHFTAPWKGGENGSRQGIASKSTCSYLSAATFVELMEVFKHAKKLFLRHMTTDVLAAIFRSPYMDQLETIFELDCRPSELVNDADGAFEEVVLRFCTNFSNGNPRRGLHIAQWAFKWDFVHRQLIPVSCFLYWAAIIKAGSAMGACA